MLDMPAVPMGLATQGPQQRPQPHDKPIAKLGGASSGRASAQEQNPNPPNMPTDQEIHRARNLADDGLTGPPPAFQASLLEVQSDIQFVIKQVEAARERANNQRATAAEAAQAEAVETAKATAATEVTPAPYGVGG